VGLVEQAEAVDVELPPLLEELVPVVDELTTLVVGVGVPIPFIMELAVDLGNGE
jgi:hypothetical protein